MDNIEIKIRNIIKTYVDLNKPIEEILLEDNLIMLGINSLNFIKIAVTIESEFDFEFDDDDLNYINFPNIKELILYVKKRI